MSTPTKLLNKKAVRDYALAVAAADRAHPFRRVGDEFFVAVETALRNTIVDRVRRHPSVGVTLK